MMRERLIQEEWVISTVQNPEMTELKRDDEKQYVKQIPQNQGKFLRVIVNPSVTLLRGNLGIFLTREYNHESNHRSRCRCGLHASD
jgi:hypothetical protein